MLRRKGSSRNLGSILNNAIHIATHTLSFPRSPRGVWRKEGEKQNCQIDNNFPSLYPPPSSSNIDKKLTGEC